MKIIDREPIGRKKFLKLEKMLALRYPPIRKKTSIDIQSLANDLKTEYGVTYANWKQGGMMAVAFAKRINLLLAHD